MMQGTKIQAALTVLVAPAAEGGYFAQGVELDYVATGATIEEAKDRFARGLVATFQEYIKRNRPIKGLFKSSPPPEVRKAYFESDSQPVFFCQVIGTDEIPSGHHIPRRLQFVQTDLTANSENLLPA